MLPISVVVCSLADIGQLRSNSALSSPQPRKRIGAGHA
jgi:hypothetical protein